MSEEQKAFGCYDNGFTLKFDNGLVLSTRFGKMNYCENRATVFEYSPPAPGGWDSLFSENAEVAVWNQNAAAVADAGCRNWVNEWQRDVFDDKSSTEDVRGWITFSEWLQVVDWCRNWEPE